MNNNEEPSGASPKYPCAICNKTIAKNQKSIRCCICNYKIHMKCNKTDKDTFEQIIRENISQICLKCKEENIPFQKLTDHHFFASTKGINKNIEDLLDIVSPSNSLKLFFNEINNLGNTTNTEVENPTSINCNYVDLNSFNYKPKKNTFSLFHTNIGSLSKHKDELETILSLLEYRFDIIGISETKLSNKSNPIIDINIQGYNCHSTATEAEKGGTLIYISDKHNYKQRKDLEGLTYKSKLLESTFIEIINPGKTNCLVGCIYRHPSMDLNEFRLSDTITRKTGY